MSRFCVVHNPSNLVRKEHLTRIRIFIENVVTSLFQKESYEIVFLRSDSWIELWESSCTEQNFPDEISWIRNEVKSGDTSVLKSNSWIELTARSLEDETRNAKLSDNWNPEWWGDFSQLVKIEKIKFLGISWYKVKLKRWFDLNSEVCCGTNSKWDLVYLNLQMTKIHHSGFRLPFNSAFLGELWWKQIEGLFGDKNCTDIEK